MTETAWTYLDSAAGPLRPGLRLLDSDCADFSIVSNSAGGEVAREYAAQLQIILEGLTVANMSISRAEVESSATAELPLSDRVLDLVFPIIMRDVSDHLGLRRTLSAAQKPIGQRPGDKGGNGNKRIRLHLKSGGVSAKEFLAGIVPVTGKYRMRRSADADEVVAQIHTLTRSEVEAALDEWTQIGRDAFFARYRAHSAVKYLISVGEMEFDAKAILIGALRRCRPELGDFKTSIFNGNAETVAQPLRRLGFDVVDMDAELPDVEDDRHERELLNREVIGPVEKHQLVKARRGQGVFRSNVEAREPRCRVTGVSDPRHLRASHIKPWRKSTDIEKIDGNNGLMLAPHVDHLFDRGFITFADDGTMLSSSQVASDILDAWKLNPRINVGPFSAEQVAYLEYHRAHVFKP